MLSKEKETREQERSPLEQLRKMRSPSQLWYVVSEPAGPSASDLTPSQHQIGRERLGCMGTPQPLDHRNVEVVGGLCDEGEGEEEEEEVYEYSWSITEAEDEAARACQYELDFDMGLFDDD